MSTRAADPKVIDGIERACRRASTADELFEVLSAEVKKVVPHDAAMWFGVDPVTLLAIAPARIENMDAGYCSVFWHTEFHDHDTGLWRDLARSPVPAASLRAQTDDQPLQSPRYRTFIRPQGYDDELRAAFRTGDSTWAVAGLYRVKSRHPFNADEVALISALSAVVASAVRTRVTMEAAAPVLSAAPGLLVFDRDGVLTSANNEAARWLTQIYGPAYADDGDAVLDMLADPTVPDLLAPVPLIALLARARAIAAGHARGQARLRLRDRSGRWLVLHASCLEGRGTDGSIAVVVEPAKSAEVAPIVIEAYGLSPRERDVVRAIAKGLSTPEIAAELFLSAHTVRDYIKSVFEKVGVSSRGELVAKLFAEHYSDPMHAAAVEIH